MLVPMLALGVTLVVIGSVGQTLTSRRKARLNAEFAELDKEFEEGYQRLSKYFPEAAGKMKAAYCRAKEEARDAEAV